MPFDVEDVSLELAGRTVLSDVSFSVRAGEHMLESTAATLVGPDGTRALPAFTSMDALAAGAVAIVTKPKLELKKFLQTNAAELIGAILDVDTPPARPRRSDITYPLRRRRVRRPIGGPAPSGAPGRG